MRPIDWLQGVAGARNVGTTAQMPTPGPALWFAPYYAQDSGTFYQCLETSPNVFSWVVIGSIGGGGWYGSGSDGQRTFDGTTTILGMVPSVNVYTASKDLFLQGPSQVNAGVTLNMAGFKLYCQGVLTNLGVISCDGFAGVTAATNAGGAGGAQSPAGSTGRGSAGGAGAAGNAVGTAGTANATGFPFGTGNGGAGGLSGGNAGGLNGAWTALNGTTTGAGQDIPSLAEGMLHGAAGVTVFGGGSGGGGGAGSGAADGGGGGGGAAGVLIVAAQQLISNVGLIHCTGGKGGNGLVATNSGGGGGGGGGVLIEITQSLQDNGGLNSTVAGGAAGASTGTAGAAVAGSGGVRIQVPT